MRDRKDDHTHRRVLETKLGRKLKPNEVSDHIDEDKTNNSPANLRVKTRSEHSHFHGLGSTKRHSRVRAALRMQRERKKLY